MQLRILAHRLSGIATSAVISALALGIVSIISNHPSNARTNKFFCTQEGGVPVTKVRTSRGNETFIRWVVDDFKKFPPAERCKIVSTRFQRYYDNGSFYITSRKNFNNYPVLCIANRKGAPCTSKNILVTLKPGTDADAALKEMLDFRRGVAQSTPVRRRQFRSRASSGSSKPVDSSECQAFTYAQGETYVNVNQLLDNKNCAE